MIWIFVLLFISSSSQVKALKLFGRKKLQCNLEVQNFLIPGLHDPVSGKCLNANCPYGAVASHPNGGQGKRNEILESISSLSVSIASLSTSVASLNASLSTSIASLTSTVASQNSSLSASIEFLNTSVATISDEVSDTLQTIIKYKPVWNTVGKTFEYVVLERLRGRKGTEAEKLAQAAKGNIDALSRWAEQHSTGDTPLSKNGKDLYYRAKNCLRLLSKYGELDSESAKVRHLMYMPLGFHLLSMNAFNLSDPKFKSGYKTEIEMDIAGTVFYVLDLYIKNCAELKLSERAEAIDQVMVRLAIFWVSSTVLLSEEDHHIVAKFHGDDDLAGEFLPPSSSSALSVSDADSSSSSSWLGWVQSVLRGQLECALTAVGLVGWVVGAALAPLVNARA
eukprot:gene34744-44932_t